MASNMVSHDVASAKTVWQLIFEKAIYKLGNTELHNIVQTWANCYSRVIKTDLAKLPSELTQQHCAELLWWKALFPDEALTGGPRWFNEQNFQHVINLVDASVTVDGNYTSMLEFIMLKASFQGIQSTVAEQRWITSSAWASTKFPDKSQHYQKFRAELQTWRMLFPTEPFPGRDPATGIFHFATQDEIVREHAQLQNRTQDAIVPVSSNIDATQVDSHAGRNSEYAAKTASPTRKRSMSPSVRVQNQGQAQQHSSFRGRTRSRSPSSDSRRYGSSLYEQERQRGPFRRRSPPRDLSPRGYGPRFSPPWGRLGRGESFTGCRGRGTHRGRGASRGRRTYRQS